MTRVDATLDDFEFKGHFAGHKVNWGHNLIFFSGTERFYSYHMYWLRYKVLNFAFTQRCIG